VTDRSAKRHQPQCSPDVPATCKSAGIPRRISASGTEGATASVVVTVQWGQVWLSIVPPFTWEAIMEPAKVEELIHVLGLARDEAQQMVVVRGRPVVQEITSQPVVHRSKAVGSK
jgi:hypothetical protein